MLSAFTNSMKVQELRQKIFITIGLLVVYRLAAYIPVPGIDASKVASQLGDNGIFGLMDMFAGGALRRFTVVAMNVNPYITASIILSLLQMVIPQLEAIAKEGPDGRKKLQQYVRYGAVVLGVVQAFGITMMLKNFLINPSFFSLTLIITSLVAGTMFLMWLGEKISEYGIGNGISLIIFAGIIARVPAQTVQVFRSLGNGGISIFSAVLFCLIAVVVIGAVIFITQGQRRIPVQYAKRVVGRRMYGGQSTHIPLKINQAGVIPVIFASSVLAFPITIAQFIPSLQILNTWFGYGTLIYNISYALLVVFFTYFYTAVSFNPVDVANNMKKYGGFIPGLRPGKPTAEYLDRVLTRLTLAGAIFLAFIAVLPNMMSHLLKLPGMSFGGTGLLIVVGVALDTVKQLESQLLMRHYEGFMK